MSPNPNHDRNKPLPQLSEEARKQLHEQVVYGGRKPLDVPVPTDAGYVRWMRLTANDKQILAIRDELRASRETIKAAEDAHADLQNQMMTVLRMIAYVMDDWARDSLADGDGYPVMLEIRRSDVDKMDGLNFDVANHEDEAGWTLTLRRKGE